MASEKLEKYEKLYKEVDSIRQKYLKEASALFRVFILFLLLTSISGVAIVLLSTLPGAPLSFILPYISLFLVLVSTIVVIVVLSYIYLSSKLREKYNIKKLKEEIVNYKERYDYYKRRVKVLEEKLNELAGSFLFRDYNVCKCYDELLSISSVLGELNKSIEYLRNTMLKSNISSESDRIIELLRDVISTLANYNELCSNIHTSEYSVKINVSPGIFKMITLLKKGLLSNGDMDSMDEFDEAYISIYFRGETYRINLYDLVFR